MVELTNTFYIKKYNNIFINNKHNCISGYVYRQVKKQKKIDGE